MRFRLKSGAALAYAPGGRGDLTLAMLHPIGLNGAVWSSLAAELGGEFRTIAVDLPGHGESDVLAAAPSIEDMAAGVLELLDPVAGGPVVFIGCSMGSAVATAAAAAGTGVAGVILANSGLGKGPERHKALTGRAQAARAGMAAVLDTTMRRWFSAEILATRPDLTAPVARWLLAGDPLVHSRGWEALRDFDYEPSLPRLTMPALVIAGTDDQASAIAAVKALADALPAADYREIAGAGHLSPWERPRDFAALVRDFIGRRLSGSTSPKQQ